MKNKFQKVKNFELRKAALHQEIEKYENGNISLEGFFDFLFGKKKEIEVDKDIDFILKHVEESENVKIKSDFKDFKTYIETLEDLVDNVLTGFDKNIDRVTKFLDFFLQHKEKSVNFESEFKKLGSFNISKVKIKDEFFFKTKYHYASIVFSNTVDHLNIDFKKLTKEQSILLEIPQLLEDIDFVFDGHRGSDVVVEIVLNQEQKTSLKHVLDKLKSKLPGMKSKVTKLEDLFTEAQKEYEKALISLSFSQEIADEEYIGFSELMFQRLYYLYGIEFGIEKDLSKEIK